VKSSCTSAAIDEDAIGKVRQLGRHEKAVRVVDVWRERDHGRELLERCLTGESAAGSPAGAD
jgi:hypothetical protein